ncbi:hypothetical protein [Burkholderia sp. Ac-20379]|uniref:hypothetical protein n=1 Tax=Burkholderia sp. Ac-20379 TaxID=2703900 RepID=UPI0019819A1B|nr:hypothetical protein [Burkholderia sp. Ac-20379]MBN3724169.1 hypothetical protein [Burkholderia sp. Ac-20379]
MAICIIRTATIVTITARWNWRDERAGGAACRPATGATAGAIRPGADHYKFLPTPAHAALIRRRSAVHLRKTQHANSGNPIFSQGKNSG